ncbi:hypothetical protein ACROYT_G017335 [Oculina patagonica]
MLIVIKRVLYIRHLVLCSFTLHGVRSGMEHLKPPEALILSAATNKAEAWRRWKMSWELYKVASGLDKKDEKIQVATLLHVLGKECVEVYSNFVWENEGDLNKIAVVEEKFKAYCAPLTSIHFNRHLFVERKQQDGETVDEFCSALKTLAKNCDLGNKEESWVTSMLVLGLKDPSAKERLMERDQNLERTLQAARISETSKQHMKTLKDESSKVEKVDSVDGSGRKHQGGIGCRNCGILHGLGRGLCPAAGKQCHKCKKMNHFARMCQSPGGQKQQVNTVYDFDSDSDSETMFIGSVNSGDQDWVETVDFGSVKEVFKLDTGAQCNVLPKTVYDKITTMPLLPSSARLESYSKTSIKPVGKCELTCCVRGQKHQVLFQVVDGSYTPLLGRASCEQMGLIQRINTISSRSILDEFPDVFQGLGCLPGRYHISIDPSVPPVIHPPRRVPHSKRDPLKKELDRMESVGIIEKVPLNEPADWVSSLVCVDKPDGSIRVCLDPRDLNKAIKREHYPLPLVEDITASCAGATLFSTLDAEKAFYQIQLDEESSKLLTFNTPFGRYRYLRMPMGIKSAPEVYQCRMEQVFEGLTGVKVIMDDIISHGSSKEEHDTHLRAVLQRARDNNLRLKKSKCHIEQEEVKFHGHVFTKDGLKTDPEKVRAVVEMPRPADKAGVQRLFGMVNYVSKLIPNMSDLTAPLRQLLHQDVEWHWEEQHEASFKKVKEALALSPVLGYYDAKKELTLQVDTSSTGLGAALIQEGQPIAYASKALTPTQQKYAQIEKELLAVVFGCAKFQEYIVGRTVTIETDHKPLESIIKKPLHASPLRLQRMLVQLQRYPEINLVYKRGVSLHLADALSRAHLEEQLTNAEQLDVNLVEHMISDPQLVRFVEETKKDEILPELQEVILSGWPESRGQVPAKLQEFWNYRDELTVYHGLVLKGQKIFTPKRLRGEMLEKLHDGHLGINKTLMKARDVLFWPGMAAEITEKIKKCPVCLENRSSQQSEPLKSHEIPPLPWAKHVTSSPGYPQSNGQSEKTVQTLKAMLEKADDPYKALLSYRNTPLEGVNLSPAQMLMGRRLRTPIPVTEDMLKPQLYDPEEVLPKLKERQRKQKMHHDKTAKELPPLKEGEVVRVKEGRKWNPARVTQVLPSPRSYKVETENGEYRRNRRHLLKTGESQTQDVTTDDDLTETGSESTSVAATPEHPETQPVVTPTTTTSRSGRTIREPERFKDYVKY